MVTNEKSFQLIGGNLVLDFCNTVHSVGQDDPQDDLETWADLLDWAKQAGILRRDVSVSGRPGDLASLKDLRASLYRIFSSLASRRKPDPDSLAEFNQHLEVALAQAKMKEKNGRYALTSRAKNFAERLRFELTSVALDLLTTGPLDRVRECAGASCSWLFMDTSRNGSRRWCEMKACGNREKIRRFRQHRNR